MDDGSDTLQEGEIADVEEFAAYGPILGCAVVPACVTALVLSWLLTLLHAPVWANYVLGLVYVTLPCGALLWWTWDKKAIRLANGRILAAQAARKSAVTLWIVTVLILVWRFMTW